MSLKRSTLATLCQESIKVRMFAIASLFVLVISICFFLYFIFQQSRFARDRLSVEGRVMAELLAYNSRLGVYTENKELLAQSIEPIEKQKHVVSVSIFDQKGRLLKDTKTAAPPAGPGNQPETPPNSHDANQQDLNRIIQTMKATRTSYYEERSGTLEVWAPVFSRYSYPEHDTVLMNIQEDHVRDPFMGYVHITMKKEWFVKGRKAWLLEGMVLVALFLCAGMGVSYLAADRITKPIKTLTQSVKNYGATGSIPDLPVESKDETGKLAIAFEEMASLVDSRNHSLKEMITSLEREVAERKSAEEALRHSQETFMALLNAIQETAFLIDTGLKVIACNETCARRLGTTVHELIGRDLFAIMPIEVAKRRKEFINSLIRTGEPVRFEDERAGRWYDTSLYPIKGTKGQVSLVAGFATDFTNRKRIEEELRQSQKMEAIGQLSGGVAHDFNNLLTVIMGFTLLLKRNIQHDETLTSYVDKIKAAVDKGAFLTKSLLAFSRKQLIKPEPVKCNDIVRHIESLLRRLIGEDIELTSEIPDENLVIFADTGQIEQCIVNLVTNARDAMPAGGLLSIATKPAEVSEHYAKGHKDIPPGDYVLLSVSDTGTGISPEIEDKIFEPFFTTKAVGKGTGLGLSSVYGMVKQNKGFIDFHSEPDKGTVFNLFFPRFLDEPAQEKQKLEIPPKRGKETILLAEDEDDVREVTRELIKSYGYRVIESRDGEEALKKFTEYTDRIHLLICDVIMPKMNGKRLCEEIRKIDTQVKVLFISGYTDNILARQGIMEKEVNIIQKPYEAEEFLARIRELLDKT